jgi:hypothetical protein
LYEEIDTDKKLERVGNEEKLVETIIQHYQMLLEKDPACTSFRLVVFSKTHKNKLQSIIEKINTN